MRQMQDQLHRMEGTLDSVRDDITVLTGVWRRDSTAVEGERLAVAGLLAKQRRIEQRLEAIEARLPAKS